MNIMMVLYIVGWVLCFEAAFMLPACLTAIIYQEQAGFALLLSMGICLLISAILLFRKPKNTAFYAREGFVTVAFCWICMSLLGALPFTISRAIPSYVDAVFETVSGFTTTGSSILSDVEALPHCLLLWRSFTHWVGGMGVLVFVMAIMPLAGGNNIHMMKAESPGPVVGKLVPRIRSTAMILYLMYIILTFLQIVFLLLGKMPVFDAFATAFGTAGTGGFGIKNDSIASYSSYLQVVITIFMLLFGVNFNFYYYLLIRKWKSAVSLSEVKVYFLIVAVSILLITCNILPLFSGFWEALKHAAFQVATIITTTGFATTDFDLWPSFSKTILVILMFIGACAGSTGGGIKVSRIIILLKNVRNELNQVVHPHNIKKLKMDGHVIEQSVLKTLHAFLGAYVILFVLSLLLISLDNFDFTTNFTAVAATINNIGPGLSQVGPTCNFGGYSVLSKLVLTFDMLAGRLEIFPMLILFTRRTWSRG